MTKGKDMATTAELNERLALYKAAEKAILQGNQSYSLDGGQTFTKADLGTIRSAINDLEAQKSKAQSGRGFAAYQVRF